MPLPWGNNPTDKPEVGPALLGKGDLGPKAGAVDFLWVLSSLQNHNGTVLELPRISTWSRTELLVVLELLVSLCVS